MMAVALKADPAADLCDVAAVHLAQGRPNEALDAASQALLVHDAAETRALFVQCVRAADRLPAVPGFRRLIARALREAWARPISLTGPAIGLVTNDPDVAAAIRLAMSAWPRRLSQGECGAALGVLVTDEVLRAVLDTALVNHPGLERLLTSIRANLLDGAAQAKAKVPREMVAFAASLARQCFATEYVFDVSDAERRTLAWLRTSARAALADRKPPAAIQLIALASYAPLSTLDRDQALLGGSWLKPLEALIAEHVRAPQTEAALRAAIPRLTEIADPVSQQVRAQYEENPYPRWTSIAPTPPETSIHAHLRGLFPDAPLRESAEPGAPDILVAGCGTGQQSIGTAQRFPHARVLAVDLSLASLAYAKHKSEAAGVAIEYAQADILQLALPRRFDMIESSGVLHHLSDPMRGWSALLDLLKPGGAMRLGFYSELGRANIVALHRLIAERGYTSSPDGIRSFRQDLISGQQERFAAILHSPNFYSISACRDLLFHVQEHRLTLPQIGAFMARHDLTFLGFELDAAIRERYRAAFPDDRTMTDLALWHRFETANPDTFRGMYQFWVQKTPQ
jgi:SAM-dependent methyltransferase